MSAQQNPVESGYYLTLPYPSGEMISARVLWYSRERKAWFRSDAAVGGMGFERVASWRPMPEQERLRAENARLREALEFYAEEHRYAPSQERPVSTPIIADHGARARAALTSTNTTP